MKDTQGRLTLVLAENWEIAGAKITEAPRGFVAETYKITASNGNYFLKVIDDSSRYSSHIKNILPALHEIHRKGLDFINYPISVINGKYFVTQDGFLYILFNFIEGQSGFKYKQEVYAEKIRRVHNFDASVVESSLPAENYEVEFISELESGLKKYSEDSELQNTVQLNLPYQKEVINRFREIQETCKAKKYKASITHGDAPGNVIYTKKDLYIIDWDDLMLAPIERDLWFHYGSKEFFSAYGDITMDMDFYSFYLFRRYLDDLSGFLDEIFKDRSNDAHVQENIEGIINDVNGWLKPEVDKILQK